MEHALLGLRLGNPAGTVLFCSEVPYYAILNILFVCILYGR